MNKLKDYQWANPEDRKIYEEGVELGREETLQKVSNIIEKVRKKHFPFEDKTMEIKPIQDELNDLINKHQAKEQERQMNLRLNDRKDLMNYLSECRKISVGDEAGVWIGYNDLVKFLKNK